MRARVFVISSLAVAAVIGTASAAHAKPQGPTQLEPKPTTSTTAPKGPDQIAPKPTTTTTVPKGPGDLAQPTGGGGVVGPEDDNGTPKGEYVPPASSADDVVVSPVADDAVANANDAVTKADDAVATPDSPSDGSHVPTLAIVVLAGGIGALLALFATRMRRDEEDAQKM